MNIKELSLCHKLWFSNPNIFGTQCRKPLIFQTYIFWSNKSHSFKFQRFTTLESKDIGIRKSEFVAKSQFLYTIYINNPILSWVPDFNSSFYPNFLHDGMISVFNFAVCKICILNSPTRSVPNLQFNVERTCIVGEVDGLLVDKLLPLLQPHISMILHQKLEGRSSLGYWPTFL